MSKLVKLNCIVLVNYDHIDRNSYDATCITEPLTKPRGVLLIVRINIVMSDFLRQCVLDSSAVGWTTNRRLSIGEASQLVTARTLRTSARPQGS